MPHACLVSTPLWVEAERGRTQLGMRPTVRSLPFVMLMQSKYGMKLSCRVSTVLVTVISHAQFVGLLCTRPISDRVQNSHLTLILLMKEDLVPFVCVFTVHTSCLVFVLPSSVLSFTKQVCSQPTGISSRCTLSATACACFSTRLVPLIGFTA